MKKTAVRILVVDDDDTIRRLFARVLRLDGYEVLQASTGTDGLQIARERRPDLVLLDVNLPDGNGLEVCQQLKAEKGLLDTFVIMVSGEATNADQKAGGLEAGADEYIIKPVESNELRARVRTMLRLRDTTVALRTQEAKYRSIFENAAEGIFQTTPECRFRSANPALARMLGYQSPEDLMSSVTQVSQLFVAPARRTELRRLLETSGMVHRFEAEGYRKNGSKIWVSLNAHVIQDETGAVLYYEGTSLDITARKLAEQWLEEALRFNQTILTASTVGILAYRASGQCVFANAAAAQIAGVSVEQLLRQNFRQLVSWQKSGQLRMAEQTLRSGQMQDAEIHVETNSGKDVWVDFRTASFDNGGEQHLLVMIYEISERKRLERAVLEASDREQRRLGQDLHDGLCQRLFSIATSCNLLRQDLGVQARPQGSKAGEIAAQLNTALLEARSLAHGLNLSNLARDGLVAALQNLAAMTRRDFRVSCAAECPDSLFFQDAAVASHLYRIAREAVYNAIKHAKPKHITIRLAAAGNMMCLSVIDDGVGLKEPKARGSGMGLDMLRYRAGLIGGELEIQTPRSGGTAVHCRFSMNSVAS